MCGIIGILGNRPVASLLIDALKRLEYRGYDSAGIALLEEGYLIRLRAEGKLINLEAKLKHCLLLGKTGIGHTRWATHGAPVERNAHPHLTENLAIVHNGIIENFILLRVMLENKGYSFETETDTEVIAFLVTDALRSGQTPFEAVQSTLVCLRGAFALAIIFKGEENLLIVARHGPPLAIGYGQGEMYAGSDATVLSMFTKCISYLEDGDWAVLTRNSATIYDISGQEVMREKKRITTGKFFVSKDNSRYFMHKEIFEQPKIISHMMDHYLNLVDLSVRLPSKKEPNWKMIEYISFACCGTSWYSTLVARYWFESLARIRVDNDVASEFRYREPPLSAGNTLSFFVSQSGETADTLASLRYCKKQNIKTATLVNVMESTMAREADIIFPTFAGPEIGVASTKTFTTQLFVLLILAISAGKVRGFLTREQEKEFVILLSKVPSFFSKILKLEAEIESFCHDLITLTTKHAIYLGRGTSWPIALEGALKLKELSYIYAEGYAAGELKHGPIALIDENMPVIVVAPYDRWFEKTLSNMQEIFARGGKIFVITDKLGKNNLSFPPQTTLILPDIAEIISPLIYAIPMQMIAYHTAILLGKDVDRPRNLAKSVTVE